jgi:hypothetical protein
MRTLKDPCVPRGFFCTREVSWLGEDCRLLVERVGRVLVEDAFVDAPLEPLVRAAAWSDIVVAD